MDKITDEQLQRLIDYYAYRIWAAVPVTPITDQSILLAFQELQTRRAAEILYPPKHLL